MAEQPSPATLRGRAAIAGGIGLMVASITLFSFNDALGKWLVQKYPVGELLLIRCVAALLLLSPFLWRAGIGAIAGVPRPGLQILRIALSSLEVAMFIWAVSNLPLADAVTYYLAGPIYVTALSFFLLGERIGWRRWTAVFVGFAGVVIALRPSSASLTLPALIALAGSLCFALLMVTTRYLRDTPSIVLVGGQVLGTLILGLLSIPFGWVPPTLDDVGLLSLFGVVSIAAVACLNLSLKLAPASIVAPYQYTMIVWAVILGYLVFGDTPDLALLAGAAIIVGAGLYIFWRERAQGRGEATMVDPPAG
jgi:drug/metabolite transporter (DMT)-like permease